MLKNCIEQAKTTYGCTIKTVVTDNSRNMEKMRKALEEENPDLITYGCLAHWLNLLGQDITPPTVIKHIVEVNKYFRNHHIPGALLQEHQGSVKPQLPGETRWKSQLKPIETFLTNRPFMITITQEHGEDIDTAIATKILNVGLYRQARDLAEQLKPVAVAIDIAQRDSTNLADGCALFLSLLEEPALQPHISAVEKRFKAAILPQHMLAYMMHPRYQGEHLTLDLVEVAKNWLVSRNPSFLPTAIAFQAQADPFPSSFFQPAALDMNVVTWWVALNASMQLPEGFLALMLQLHSACASSASLERVFSNFGIIQSRLRNRLGLQKAAKLVFCYRMLRGPSELEYWMGPILRTISFIWW